MPNVVSTVAASSGGFIDNARSKNDELGERKGSRTTVQLLQEFSLLEIAWGAE